MTLGDNDLELISFTEIMPGMSFLANPGTSPSSRPSKRTRSSGAPQQQGSGLEKQVQDLTRQLNKVCQLVANHDRSLRELEAWSMRTWLFDKESELAKELMKHMDGWKQLMPSRGQAHPQGPARLTVAAALAKWMIQEPERRQVMPKFTTMHDEMQEISDVHRSVQLAFVKPVKDGRICVEDSPTARCRRRVAGSLQVDASFLGSAQG